MPAIRHLHSRFVDASLAQVRPALDALWSGSDEDAFPHEHIRRWRVVPEGGVGFSLGARFGHGPYRFTIDHCDEHMVSARIETPGYEGFHRFELVREGKGVRIVHDLQASVAPGQWLIWTLAVGKAHDWAVEACLARLEGVITKGRTDAVEAPPPPWQLRVFIELRKLTRRLARTERQRTTHARPVV